MQTAVPVHTRVVLFATNRGTEYSVTASVMDQPLAHLLIKMVRR